MESSDSSLHELMLQLLKRQDALESVINEQKELLKSLSISRGQHLDLATSSSPRGAEGSNGANVNVKSGTEPSVPEAGPSKPKLQQFPSFHFMGSGKARAVSDGGGSSKPLPVLLNGSRAMSGASQDEERQLRKSDTGLSIPSSPPLPLEAGGLSYEPSDRDRTSPSTKRNSDPDSDGRLSTISGYEGGPKLLGIEAMAEEAKLHRKNRMKQSNYVSSSDGRPLLEQSDGRRSRCRTPRTSEKLQRIEDNEDVPLPSVKGQVSSESSWLKVDHASTGSVSLVMAEANTCPQSKYIKCDSLALEDSPLPVRGHSDAYPTSPEPFLTSKTSTAVVSRHFSWGLSSLTQQSPNRQETTHLAVKILNKVFWEIWNPDDLYHIYWDMIMLCLMFYIVIFTPYFIAFDISTSNLNSAAAIADLIVNCFFMLDVLLMFRCSYPDPNPNAKEKLVTNRWRIAKHYLFGWFLVDVISSLPWSQILAVPANNSQSVTMVLRVARLIRLLRLFQVTKVVRVLTRSNIKNFVSEMEAAVGRTSMRMIQLLLLAFALIHWSACVFYFTANVQGQGANTWLMDYQLFILDDNGQVGYSAPNIVRYICALYWAVVTMTTLGYGDITPVSVAEKIVAIFIILIGATLFAYFMASIASIIHASDSAAGRMMKRKVYVEDFIKHRNIPKPLSTKVEDFCSYTLERKVLKEEAEILAGLSMSLKTQVVMHLYKGVIEKVPLFWEVRDAEGKPTKFKAPHFITTLVTCLKLEYYAEGDIVVRQWEMGREMYFIGEAGNKKDDEEKVDGKCGLSFRVYERDFGSNANSKAEEKPSPAVSATKSPFSRTSLNVSKLVRESLSQMRSRSKKRTDEVKSSTHSTYLVEEELKEDGIQYEEVDRLYSGGNFGLYSCVLGEPRSATVVARGLCEVHSLRRSDLDEVLKQWPEFSSDLHAMLQDESYHEIEDKCWRRREEMRLPVRSGQYGEASERRLEPRPSRETPLLNSISSLRIKPVPRDPFHHTNSLGRPPFDGGLAVPQFTRLSASSRLQDSLTSGVPDKSTKEPMDPSAVEARSPFSSASPSKGHITWSTDAPSDDKAAAQSSARAEAELLPAADSSPPPSYQGPASAPDIRPPSLLDGVASIAGAITRTSAGSDHVPGEGLGRGISLKAWESKGLVSQLKGEHMRQDSLSREKGFKRGSGREIQEADDNQEKG